MRPTCASGDYCVFTGGCSSECPFDVLNDAMTCPASETFCSIEMNCDVGGDTCAAPGGMS